MEVPRDYIFEFFKLPYDIQRTILIEELSFANINNFCTAVRKALAEDASQFEQDFCGEHKSTPFQRYRLVLGFF